VNKQRQSAATNEERKPWLQCGPSIEKRAADRKRRPHAMKTTNPSEIDQPLNEAPGKHIIPKGTQQ
jgi:hypothetical protein